MGARVVFIYDSTVTPWHDVHIGRMKVKLKSLRAKGFACELMDTRHMPDEELEEWRKQALAAAVSRKQRIRVTLGSSAVHLGKHVPALFVYGKDAAVPIAVYPHQTRGTHEEITIEEALSEMLEEEN